MSDPSSTKWMNYNSWYNPTKTTVTILPSASQRPGWINQCPIKWWHFQVLHYTVPIDQPSYCTKQKEAVYASWEIIAGAQIVQNSLMCVPHIWSTSLSIAGRPTLHRSLHFDSITFIWVWICGKFTPDTVITILGDSTRPPCHPSSPATIGR